KISAEHGTHIDELLESIHGLLPVASETDDSATPAPDETAIKLAIVGRPNVGKSAMVNSIIGSYKRCVGDYAGLTRESASLEFNFRGQQVVIIDTPGLRRKSRITDTLEMITTSNCRNAYKSADVVILVIDASSLICGEIESYDLKIAADVVKEGKAIIIAFNKCDLTPFDFNDTPEFLKRNFMMSFSQLKEVPYLFVSALLNKNIDRLMKLMLSSYHKRCRKIKTSDLNSWLHSIRDAGVLQSGGSRFSLKYITQVRASPPTFLIFVSNSENMRNDQKRFVINNLKNHFEMGDVVTRIIFKNQKRVSGR
ncbi:MAG: 50S ribosome-binding GTPase, partial [Holosporales bacterium]|nr:50S ribosome-binding GTPase [Holosporales bacterium]